MGSHNADIRKNTYVNWRLDENDLIANLLVFARAYYEAAHMIARSILQDNSGKSADSLVFPMLFDINQALELYLKALQAMLNTLLGNGRKFNGGHYLVGHYGEFMSLLRRFEREHPDVGGDKKELDALLSSVSSYIGELKDVFPERQRVSMDYPRYPVMSDKRTAHFYVKERDNVTVDVEYFIERIEQMFLGFDSLAGYFDLHVDYTRQARA